MTTKTPTLEERIQDAWNNYDGIRGSSFVEDFARSELEALREKICKLSRTEHPDYNAEFLDREDVLDLIEEQLK